MIQSRFITALLSPSNWLMPLLVIALTSALLSALTTFGFFDVCSGESSRHVDITFFSPSTSYKTTEDALRYGDTLVATNSATVCASLDIGAALRCSVRRRTNRFVDARHSYIWVHVSMSSNIFIQPQIAAITSTVCLILSYCVRRCAACTRL